MNRYSSLKTAQCQLNLLFILLCAELMVCYFILHFNETCAKLGEILMNLLNYKISILEPQIFNCNSTWSLLKIHLELIFALNNFMHWHMIHCMHWDFSVLIHKCICYNRNPTQHNSDDDI